jgi:chromosome segregation ATPase
MEKKSSKKAGKAKSDSGSPGKPSDLVATVRKGAEAMKQLAGAYDSQDKRVAGVEKRVADYSGQLSAVQEQYQGVERRVEALESRKPSADATARRNANEAKRLAEEVEAKLPGYLRSEQADQRYATQKTVDESVAAAKTEMEKKMAQATGLRLSAADKKALAEANDIYDKLLK